MELCILMVAHGEPYITLVPFQAKYTFEEKESVMVFFIIIIDWACSITLGNTTCFVHIVGYFA